MGLFVKCDAPHAHGLLRCHDFGQSQGKLLASTCLRIIQADSDLEGERICPGPLRGGRGLAGVNPAVSFRQQFRDTAHYDR